MGHTRLSIQDLSENGNQPMFSDDKRYVIIFNGEIYNHQELRKQFEATEQNGWIPSYTFQTQSDCEVILALYKEKGADFIDEMKGIFGFAIYDVEKDVLSILTLVHFQLSLSVLDTFVICAQVFYFKPLVIDFLS